MNISKENRFGSEVRAAIWLRTVTLVAAYSIAILVTYKLMFVHVFRSDPLALALTFFTVQGLMIVILLAVLLTRKITSQIRKRREQRLYPVMRAKLAEHAISSNSLAQLQRLRCKFPAEFETCLADFLPMLTGEGSQHLSQLAIDLGLVERWKQQAQAGRVGIREKAVLRLGRLTIPVARPWLLAALKDDSMEIRLEACRALIHAAQIEELEQVFHFALTQPLGVRAVLVEELRPHALQLAQNALPVALRNEDERLVIRALEIVAAWRRALPLPEITELLRHRQPQIRAAALRVLHYALTDDDPTLAVLSALTSEDAQVKSDGATAAGRLKIAQALPELLACLRDQNAEVVYAAARALGELGADGVEILEGEILTAKRSVATAALEALERVRIGRHEYAGL